MAAAKRLRERGEIRKRGVKENERAEGYYCCERTKKKWKIGSLGRIGSLTVVVALSLFPGRSAFPAISNCREDRDSKIDGTQTFCFHR